VEAFISLEEKLFNLGFAEFQLNNALRRETRLWDVFQAGRETGNNNNKKTPSVPVISACKGE